MLRDPPSRPARDQKGTGSEGKVGGEKGREKSMESPEKGRVEINFD